MLTFCLLNSMTHGTFMLKGASCRIVALPVVRLSPVAAWSPAPPHVRVPSHLFTSCASRSWPSISLCHARRGVHERAYMELGEDVNRAEAYETARDALLQLNLMTQRGIEPDALMYTSLISVMARAGLEWQAYKLFSRMIEMNVRPLPETYVALRDATSPKRVDLRAQIDVKIVESLELLPGQLAEDELARRRTEDQMCIAKFHDYIRGELPPPMSAFGATGACDGAPVDDTAKAKLTASASTTSRQVDSDAAPQAAQEAHNGHDASDAHSSPSDASQTSTHSSSHAMARPLSMMHIRHPQDAWSIATYAQEMRQNCSGGRPYGSHSHSPHDGDLATQPELAQALQILHDEELRIYLAVHRQLRHGTREQLMQRILRTIDHSAVRDMLARRRHYFRAVESLLENDLRALPSHPVKSDASDSVPTNTECHTAAHAGDALCTHTRCDHVSTNTDGDATADDLFSSLDDSSLCSNRPEAAAHGKVAQGTPPIVSAEQTPTSTTGSTTTAAGDVLTAHEQHGIAPEVMHTPWGMLRKPRHAAAATAPVGATSTAASLERLARIRLSSDEVALVCRRAVSGELDELPESLLRRYAYQYQLRWRRRQPLSLMEAVQWHAQTLLTHRSPSSASSSSSWRTSDAAKEDEGAVYTRALRLQQQQAEQLGMRETLANYDAFRIIAQRTNNLQVVDHAEINLHLRRVRREADRRERRMTQQQRRESNVLAAAELAAAARRFSSCDENDVASEAADDTPTSLCGPDNAHHQTSLHGDAPEPEAAKATTSDRVDTSCDDNKVFEPTRERPATTEEELPPWAIFAGEDEFHLDTGHFGRPELGRYRELSDSAMAVLPSRAAQSTYRVDTRLLPHALRATVQEATWEAQSRAASVEAEYAERRRHRRYRRWDDFLRRAQAKQREQRKSEAEGAQKPLPPRRRMAQLLRRGSDQQRVSPEMINKYTRSY